MKTARRLEPPHSLDARPRGTGAPWCAATDAGAHAPGFSVLELLVSVSLVAVVMTIVLTTFDVNSALSRVQQDVSELQQSVRVSQREIGRNARMAGRGGLPRPLAFRVNQNVGTGLSIGSDDDGKILPGTDVLTLRGTFTSPIYKVDAGDEDTFTIAGDEATLLIDDVTRSGFEQPLDRLAELEMAGGGGDPEPILLVSRQGDAIYAVVQLVGISIAEAQLPQGNTVNRATLRFNINPTVGEYNGGYLALSSGGAWPATLTSVLFASVLEEYRYYVREDHTIPLDDTSPLSPKLSRARVVPGTGVDPLTGDILLGTETVHPEAGSVAVDIADGIFDLQLALGIDLNLDGEIDEVPGGAPLPGEDPDEWLWNHVDDDEDDPAWDAAALRLLRLSFLGQAGRPDRQYVAPAIATLEDRIYAEPQVPTDPAEIAARRYRRRFLQSVIDLRNL